MKKQQALIGTSGTNCLTGYASKTKKYKLYSHELTQEQFKLIEKYLPIVKLTRPLKYAKIDFINAMFYVLKTGCQWRELPEKYPPFKSVHRYFRILCMKFVWNKIVKHINMEYVKPKHYGQKNNSGVKIKTSKCKISCPDAMLIIDSKSIRTSNYYNGSFKGRDGNKKIKGIKLCPVIDRARRLWSLQMYSANTDECKCFKIGLERAIVPKIKPNAKIVIADRYFDSQPFKEYTKRILNLDTYTLKRIPKRKFELPEDKIRTKYLEKKMQELVNPHRYLIEQFFAHLEQARRLVQVYERKTSSYLGFVNLRVIQMMIRRMG